LVNIAQTASIKPAHQRDARWDVEREGRETKVEPPSEVKRVCTGDFGTSARHPPRERIDSQISKSLPREGVAALPYTEHLTSAKHPSSITAANSHAVRPYTELVNIAKTASIKPAHQRDARWDVEREGRETKV
jgi:hypothetical protein